MNILFVCKWNRFRSKAAEALFKEMNKNSNNKADSGGLFPGIPVSKDIIMAGKKFNIDITKKQQGLPHKLLMWADKIIIVANDVPSSIFKEIKENGGEDIIHWNIPDYEGTDIKKREKIIGEIKKKIDTLLKEIN